MLIAQGSSVTLHRRDGDWFYITTDDGTEGWMSGEVLNITVKEADTAGIPTVTLVSPEPDTTVPPSGTPTKPRTMESVVIVGANLRAGPSLDDKVLAVIAKDTSVTLHRRDGSWFYVTTEDGTEGWMDEEVLGITVEEADGVPTVESTP